jgi:hypothetical protein
MQGKVVEKEGSLVAGAVASAEMAVGTELWLIWADIAIEQAQFARAARAAIVGQVAAGQQPDLNTELHPALIAIAGAAASLDGFAKEVEKTGVPIKTPSIQQPTRAHWIWETLRAGFDVNAKANTWPREIKELFGLRVGGLHPKTVFGQPAHHPVVPNVSETRAIYTTEAADRAVAIMRDIYKTCRTSVRIAYPALVTRMSGLDGALTRVAP